MMQSLIGFDKWLFIALNSSLHWAPIDVIMMYVSEVKHFYLIYALLLGFLYWKGGTRGRTAVISLAVTLILTDQISAHFIKPFIDRLRPCHALPNVINLGGCGAGSSFPSTHATNLFGMAVVLTAFFPRGRFLYFMYALLVCYSRIHIGVHYPLDVVSGAALGSMVAWGVVSVARSINANGGKYLQAIGNYQATFRRLGEWFVKQRYAPPVLSGILLGLAFPPSHIGILAAIGFVPLLFAIEFDLQRTRFQTFKLLYVAFFVFHGIANYWVGGWTKETDPFLMVSCVALMLVHPLFLSVPMYFYVWARKRLGLMTALFLLPFLWTAFEFLHSFGDLGYPWLTLGNTQTYYTEGIQFIEYTGVYGVSFLLVA
ncbi:MAG TPA: phosphatase PAP2 family protein, partial [Candidatus Kapabacteria bacterium]|nr:phosphatase PAP2 family protein [Candidatus Kapabacteria bacterium]